MKTDIDVAIVGAGPYGLSLSSHLSAKRVEHRIFGAPMESWVKNMPKGMLLKSEGFASSLSHPSRYTLAAFCKETGTEYAPIGNPVPLEVFAGYGLTFQNRFVPHLERREVTHITRERRGFRIVLDMGASFSARRVVVAAGIGAFAFVPPEFDLPDTLCSHSSRHPDPGKFAGRDVAVIGGGASGVDMAVLLHEAGARPTLIARARELAMHAPGPNPRPFGERLRRPNSGIGPSWRSRFYTDFPGLFRLLPEGHRLAVAHRYPVPAGGWFMKERLESCVPVMTGEHLKEMEEKGGRVRLTLAGRNGVRTQIEVDHVIAATGYRVDLARLSFLDDPLRARIKLTGSSPWLSPNFESSVRGLYFVGPVAADTFGPLMRFVFGTAFASKRLARHLRRTARRLSRAPAPWRLANAPVS